MRRQGQGECMNASYDRDGTLEMFLQGTSATRPTRTRECPAWAQAEAYCTCIFRDHIYGTGEGRGGAWTGITPFESSVLGDDIGLGAGWTRLPWRQEDTQVEIKQPKSWTPNRPLPSSTATLYCNVNCDIKTISYRGDLSKMTREGTPGVLLNYLVKILISCARGMGDTTRILNALVTTVYHIVMRDMRVEPVLKPAIHQN
ncbi:hypothetical protein CHU98_g5218 [Xylaria longipes]|nr:hypothetical protein CHU98_g5218 [Xylaria longipes]